MERLTRKKLENMNGADYVMCIHGNEDCNDYCRYGTCKWNDRATKKLWEYENTCLSPKDIEDGRMFPCWIPVSERLPEDGKYILLSFSNFSFPAVGRYEKDEEGGAFYLGDCEEEDTCAANDLFVNAWIPLPEPYKHEN